MEGRDERPTRWSRWGRFRMRAVQNTHSIDAPNKRAKIGPAGCRARPTSRIGVASRYRGVGRMCPDQLEVYASIAAAVIAFSKP
jgi:hypothetical protein